MATLFEEYPPGKAWDEMIDPSGAVREPLRALHTSLQRMGANELPASVDTLARAYLDQGVTFDVGG